jgi:hypothetical protein
VEISAVPTRRLPPGFRASTHMALLGPVRGSPSSSFELLDDELATLCLSWLCGRDLCHVGCVSRRFHLLSAEPVLWRQALHLLPSGERLERRAEHRARCLAGSAVTVPTPDGHGASGAGADADAGVGAVDRRRLVQLASAMERGTMARWQRLRMSNALRGQEGHSAALLGGRWMVVVAGFGGSVQNVVSAV